MKIGIVLGTRPQIIKLGPIIRLLQNQSEDEFFIVNTGQHVRYDMDGHFWSELGLNPPKHALLDFSPEKTLFAVKSILSDEQPDVVIVQGDTDSALLGAVATVANGILLAHTEAGLRSGDIRMKEERNRIQIDHMAHFLFAPHTWSKKALIYEKVNGHIEDTGHLIAESIHHCMNLETNSYDEVEKRDQALLTIHRPETVDVEEHLAAVLAAIATLRKTVIFPVHPRTEARIEAFGLPVPSNISIMNPVGYYEMLRLEQESKLVITDSGGIQEEACILGTPCVTVRESTERPETLAIGANMLTGYKPEVIATAVHYQYGRKPDWTSPYGVNASSNIIEYLRGNV